MAAWFLAACLMASPSVEAPDAVVVCPDAFQSALAPWLEYRRGQGHSPVVISNQLSPEEIREQIRNHAKSGRLKYVMLVGDADMRSFTEPELRARSVPTHYAKAKVNVRWGSEPHIAADNWYADLDDDQLPELAIGRLTADTPAELARMVEKIQAYERSTDLGLWRRQVNLVAGVGGFGATIDGLLESAARMFITKNIPEAFPTCVAFASPASPFCPDPRRFRATVLDQFNEGSWFWVYVGHGLPFRLGQINAPGGPYPILTNADVAGMNCRRGAPIALFLACYAGAFDAYEECLAERMLREPHGPVAVLAGSRMTMPYAMTIFGVELMREFFNKQTPTLGLAIQNAKRQTAAGPGPWAVDRLMLDGIAAAISPGREGLAAERLEHVQMFNLLGDPMLQLKYPKKLTIRLAERKSADESIRVTGESPIAGRCTIELAARRGTLTFQPPQRASFPAAPDAMAEFQKVYRRANDSRLATTEIAVPAGHFAAELKLPPDSPKACCVRVFVEGESECALGDALVPAVDTSTSPGARSENP